MNERLKLIKTQTMTIQEANLKITIAFLLGAFLGGIIWQLIDISKR
jgi:hypothetical protein